MRPGRRQRSFISTLLAVSSRTKILRVSPFSECRNSSRPILTGQKRRKKNQQDDGEPAPEIYHALPPTTGVSLAAIQKEEWDPSNFALPTPTYTSTSAGLSATLSTPAWPEGIIFQPNHAGPSQLTQSAPPHPSYLNTGSSSLPDPPSVTQSNATPVSLTESTGSNSALSPAARVKRRRQHSPDATRRIVAANFSNETDALEILANAAAENDSDDQEKTSPTVEMKKGVKWELKDDQAKVKGLAEYCLVTAGLMTVQDVENLVRLFFECHHPVLVSVHDCWS